MPPFQGGGEMIKEVHFEKTTFNDLPINLEAEHPIPGTSSHSDLPIDLK
jgi:cysteine desulfurase/selenocysteine lyase